MNSSSPPPRSTRHGRRATVFAVIVALVVTWITTSVVRGLSEPLAPMTERSNGRITRIERCPDEPTTLCQLLHCEKALREAGVAFPRAYSMRTNHALQRLDATEYVFKFEDHDQPQFVACRMRGYAVLWAGRIGEDEYERSGKRPTIP